MCFRYQKGYEISPLFKWVKSVFFGSKKYLCKGFPFKKQITEIIAECRIKVIQNNLYTNLKL